MLIGLFYTTRIPGTGTNFFQMKGPVYNGEAVKQMLRNNAQCGIYSLHFQLPIILINPFPYTFKNFILT